MAQDAVLGALEGAERDAGDTVGRWSQRYQREALLNGERRLASDARTALNVRLGQIHGSLYQAQQELAVLVKAVSDARALIEIDRQPDGAPADTARSQALLANHQYRVEVKAANIKKKLSLVADHFDSLPAILSKYNASQAAPARQDTAGQAGISKQAATEMTTTGPKIDDGRSVPHPTSIQTPSPTLAQKPLPAINKLGLPNPPAVQVVAPAGTISERQAPREEGFASKAPPSRSDANQSPLAPSKAPETQDQKPTTSRIESATRTAARLPRPLKGQSLRQFLQIENCALLSGMPLGWGPGQFTSPEEYEERVRATKAVASRAQAYIAEGAELSAEAGKIVEACERGLRALRNIATLLWIAEGNGKYVQDARVTREERDAAARSLGCKNADDPYLRQVLGDNIARVRTKLFPAPSHPSDRGRDGR